MSQENIEIVRRIHQFWSERDFSVFAELFEPNVVLDMSRNVFNPDVYRGRDGMRRWGAGVDEIWEDFDAHPAEIIEVGDRVVTLTRISGRGRASGIDVEMQGFNVWTFCEGRVSQIAVGYEERDDALEAAGLSE